MILNTDFKEIVRYASKAPSGHNTQPWKFSISKKQITIHPDFRVALPIVDGDHRELFISLGCATENLFIAAKHFGYEPHLVEYNQERIVIGLTQSSRTTEDGLFHYIEKRQSNHQIYTGDKVPNEIVEKLKSIPTENQIHFYLSEIGSSFAHILTAYITRGNNIQMNNTAFKNELCSWMRFNQKQIRATQNGLSYRVFGNPPLPSIIARPIVKLFLKPDKQNQSDKKWIDSSSHFVLFTTHANTLKEWIDLGRTLQRFLLKANEAGIACAFMNQPCESMVLASELRIQLAIQEEYPTILVRMGYAQPVPYSPRKPVDYLLE